jgi:DNA-binding transcriptional ArsR family regulator
MSELILPHRHGDETQIAKTKALLDQIEHFQTVADLFKQLGDTSRLRIFWFLCHNEECVINIAAMMEMTTPAVSHHLKQLRSSGLISSRRDGKEVYYQASDTEQSRYLHQAIEQVMHIACPDFHAAAPDQDHVPSDL